MSKIILEEKYIFEYIRDMINDSQNKTTSIRDSRYHHTTRYEDASSICRNGILNAIDLKNKKIKDYSDEMIKIMGDIESHVNGEDGVSLAVMGLDDLYSNEEEYNAFAPYDVDFLVSSDIKVGRSSLHFGNEFIHRGSIDKSNLSAVDIRILELMKLYENGRIKKIEEIINRFNCIGDISTSMIESNLDIPLREMSYDKDLSLDIDRLSSIPKVYKKM